MRQVADELGRNVPSGFMLFCKSFMKKEHYWDKYKYPRAIKSRSDFVKVFVGPYFKAIEDVLFSHPAFIKHIPIKDRPEYIYDMLAKWGKWYVTDYTSFESSFSPLVMEALELVLYEHMLMHYPGMFEFIRDMLTGENRCVFKDATVEVMGKRMSGEMCTSLGNGFSNLMLFKFVVYEKGGECAGVVEGDDGEFGSSVTISGEDFLTLGFTIKLVELNDLFSGSFCGLMLTRELTSMTDPRKALVRFGTSLSPVALGSDNARLGLLRAKALSLVYEHPRCPILTQLGLRYIALTKGHNAIFESDYWHSHVAQETLSNEEWTMLQVARGISPGIREDFERLYGIDTCSQLQIEQYIASHDISELDHPAIEALYAPSFVGREYYERYVSDYWREYDWPAAFEPHRVGQF